MIRTCFQSVIDNINALLESVIANFFLTTKPLLPFFALHNLLLIINEFFYH